MSIFRNTEKQVDQEVFAIYDAKSRTYNQPIFALNSLIIVREIEAMFTDPEQRKNFMVTNSEDYTLFKVGEYDRRTGKLEGCAPQAVHSIHEIRAMVQSRLQQQQAMQNAQAQTLRDVSQ